MGWWLGVTSPPLPQKHGNPPDLTKLPRCGRGDQKSKKTIGHRLHFDQPKMTRDDGLQKI